MKPRFLFFSIQEHLGAGEHRTVEYIADGAEALGAEAYRLSIPIGTLFTATLTNDVEAGITELRIKEKNWVIHSLSTK